MISATVKGTPSRLAMLAVSTGTDDAFTAGPEGRAAVTDIIAANGSASPVRLTVGIDALTIGSQIIPNSEIPGYSTMQFSGFLVMEAGEVLKATASDTGITLTVSGAESI